MPRYLIDLSQGWEAIDVTGRAAEVTDHLIAAGSDGITAVDFPPGVRLAAFVHKLKKLGLPIEAITERHGGPFAGNHARYRLKGRVRRVSP